jgi:hypothetical protein
MAINPRNVAGNGIVGQGAAVAADIAKECDRQNRTGKVLVGAGDGQDNPRSEETPRNREGKPQKG